MKNKLFILTAIAGLGIIAACTKKEPVPATPATIARTIEFVCSDTDAAKFYTDETESKVFPMIKGEVATFSCKVTPDPSELTYPEIVWVSSDETVVKVEDGRITAVKGGAATVTAKQATVNLGVFASVLVKVSETLVPVESIEITDNAQEIDEETGLPKCAVGETMQMKAKINPAEATYQTAIWSSANPQIASVDPVSGVATGLSQGKVKIIATALDGSGVTGEHEIYIEKIVTPTGIKLLETLEGSVWSPTDGKHQIEFALQPEGATKSLVKWTASDPTAVTISARGEMSFIHYGKVTITAEVPEGSEAPEGYTSSISFQINIPAGYYNDHCDNQWFKQDTNGSVGEYRYNETTGENYYYVVPNTGSKFRGDFKFFPPVWNDGWSDNNYTVLDRTNYPIVTFRLDDLGDKGATQRSIFIDTNNGYILSSGTNTKVYSGRMGGGGANKWQKKYKCSDGSCIIVFNNNEQAWQNGGMLPENDLVIFNHFKIGYADIAGMPSPEEAAFRYFWFHTFKNTDELNAYLTQWSTKTGITYEE